MNRLSTMNPFLRKVLMAMLITALLIIPQTGCGSNGKTNNNPGISKTSFALDTVCTVTIFGMDAEHTEQEILQLITDAFKLCTEYENVLSKTIETSDIARINAAGGQPVTVSETALEVIQSGIQYGQLSGGAFDITIGKATDLWNFRDEERIGEIPDADVLAEAMKHVDYTKIDVDAEAGTVTLADPAMELDLGGIAKGYIADRVTEFLESRGVTSGVVDLGGNIAVIGGKSFEAMDSGDEEDSQSDFSIGVKDPLSPSGDLLALVYGRDKTVVTSGTYERYFEVDGVRYHHILSSQTGYPTDTDVISVTIVADKGRSVDCDGLSTSCLALGIEKGLELIEKVDGVDAIFVDAEGKVYQTGGEHLEGIQYADESRVQK